MASLRDLFTDEQWQHMNDNKDDTLVPVLIALPSVLGVLCVGFVVLRIMARKMSMGQIQLDWSDWLCVAGLMWTLALYVTAAVGTRYGLGRHVVVVDDLRTIYIFFLLINGFHPVAMCSLKLSLMVLYHKIFASRRFRWCCWAVGVFVALWTVLAEVGGIALCVPIDKLWDSSIDGGVCIDLAPIGLAVTLCHIVTDFIILFMPIPMVARLNTTRRKKTLIISTFVVGGGACLVSIARLPVWMSTESVHNVSWDHVPSGLMAMAELCVGILATCFPVYRPLLHWFTGKDSGNDSSAAKAAYYARTKPRTGFTRVQENRSIDGSEAQTPGVITRTDEFELVTHSVQGSEGDIGGGFADRDTDHLFGATARVAANNKAL